MLRRLKYWLTLRLPLRLRDLSINFLALFFGHKLVTSAFRSLFKGRGLIGALPDGNRLAYPLDDFRIMTIISEIYHKEIYNVAQAEQFKYILDVGAHIGLFTLQMSKQAVKARILAFEPNPDNYHFLVKNIRLNKLGERVSSHDVAVGDKSGRGVLHFGSLSRGDSSLKDQFLVDALESATVSVVPLDDVLSEPKVVDLVKIDVEGMETEVLQGLERQYTKVKRLVIEIHLSVVKEFEIHKWLSNHGYIIGRTLNLYDKCLILEAHHTSILQS